MRASVIRPLSWTLLGALVATACLVVSPLEDYKGAEQAAGGKHGSGGMHGSSGPEDAAVDASGGGAGGAETGPANGCKSNAECTVNAADTPSRCRPSDRTCVQLQTPECPSVYGDATNPNAIFFGAFATLDPSVAVDDLAIVRAHRLALLELSGDSAAGLPGGPGGARRPLVMIVCNNDRKVVETGLTHLADEVQVPAVLATLQPGDLLRGFEAHRDRNMFFLSPVGATRTIVDEDDRPPGAESSSAGLIWTLLGQPSDLAGAYAAVMSRAETYVKGFPEIKGRDIKVALVTTTEAFDSELGNAVADVLTFNGKSAADNGALYRARTVDIEQPKLDEISQDIVDFRPDIIVSAAGAPFTQSGGIFETIEQFWGDQLRRPFYVLSPTNSGDTSGIITLIRNHITFGTDRTANRRIVGVDGAGPEDRTLQNAFASRLGKQFENPVVETGNYYDAVYFLAYAMYGATALEGPAIADGMLRLLEGPAIGVGPTPIPSVYRALDVPGGTIELDGTLGTPNFDRKTGTRLDDGAVYCFEYSTQTDVRLRSEVLRYHRDSGELTGTFPCFSGFFP